MWPWEHIFGEGPKRDNLPSVASIRKLVKHYYNQRAEFVLTKGRLLDAFKEVFDINRPVTVNGIFGGVFKKPKVTWGDDYWSKEVGPTTFFLLFRGCVFKQDDKEIILFHTRDGRFNRTRTIEFDVQEIQSMKVAEIIRSLIPKLPAAT